MGKSTNPINTDDPEFELDAENDSLDDIPSKSVSNLIY